MLVWVGRQVVGVVFSFCQVVPQTELRSSVSWQASLPTEAPHQPHELFIHLLILKTANNKSPWQRPATLNLSAATLLGGLTTLLQGLPKTI